MTYQLQLGLTAAPRADNVYILLKKHAGSAPRLPIGYTSQKLRPRAELAPGRQFSGL